MDNVLSLAVEALSWVELEDLSCSSALARAAKQLGISDERTIAEARLLVRNSLHRKNFIDRLLGMALDPISLDEFNLGTQSFLRIFVFKTKLDFKGVDVYEIVEAGRSVLGWETLAPVEEVFGKVLRIDAGEVLSGLDDCTGISLRTFYPEWFVSYCVRLMGRREALRLLGYSASPPTYVRINTLKGKEEEEILENIAGSSVVLDKVGEVPYLYRVARGAERLTRLEAYAKGLFSLQGLPSCLAALLCEPQRGDVVFDVGFRPVAKTTYLAQLMNNEGRILSMDSSARRIETLELEVKEMGVEIVEASLVEAGETPTLGGKADLVLLSPRCSGTGVFWRDPALKWRVDLNRVGDAADAQWDLISKYADYVRDGGRLIYWTNSLTVEENELLVERFLKMRPEFSLVETKPRIGVSGLRGQRECQRLYPHLHGVDGAYFAKLIKR